MTMPHLENCPHMPDGWCLDCVKEMGEQLIDLRLAIVKVSNITLLSTYASGQSLDDPPDCIEVNDIVAWREAMDAVLEVCKKYLI